MIPNSLLARTFLLLAALVVLTTAAWLSLFRYIEAEPRARESAQLAASAVNLIRAALFAAAPERRPGLFTELSTREGIRLIPAEPEDRVEPMPDSRFHRLMQRELQARLGPGTRVAAEVDGVPGFWVSFRLDDDDDDEYWLALPRERAARAIARHWLLWGLLALGLALAAAWLIASRLSRPLRALARSADAVGRGQRPEPLPETGAEEMRRLAAAFNAMAGDLARHDRERSEVLAGISHDLRTPLTRLRLEAEMSIADDDARAAVVADIGQMEGVIGQFMDYARTDDGEEAEATDLGTLLEGIAAHQRRIGRPLAVDLAPLPRLAVRPRALARAVANLIDNAARYGAGEIRLSARQADGEIRIEVADRGPGVPPAEAERLKRPFTRLDAARTNASGTGLGLAIVDRVARLHGGRLELLENPGGGLLARLVLPLD
jgi:two-component system osmolarity sensor histidine kinase EnvZ